MAPKTLGSSDAGRSGRWLGTFLPHGTLCGCFQDDPSWLWIFWHAWVDAKRCHPPSHRDPTYVHNAFKSRFAKAMAPRFHFLLQSGVPGKLLRYDFSSTSLEKRRFESLCSHDFGSDSARVMDPLPTSPALPRRHLRFCATPPSAPPPASLPLRYRVLHAW